MTLFATSPSPSAPPDSTGKNNPTLTSTVEALAIQLDVPVSTLPPGWILAALHAIREESVMTALDWITVDVQRLRELVA